MKTILLINLLAILTLSANELSFDDKKKLLILEEIQKSIEKDYNLQGQIKKIIIAPAPITQPPKKTLGQQKIEQQLIKNRSRLQGDTKKLTGKDKIQMMLEKNRNKLKQKQLELKNRQKNKRNEKVMNSGKNSDDWITQKQTTINNWQNTRLKEIKKWEDEKLKILNSWKKDAFQYKKRVPEYKKNLPPIPIPNIVYTKKKQPLIVEKKYLKKKIIKKTKEVKLPIFKDYYIIPQAFDLQVKDQGKRPTCAAFAGVRAVEILMAQSGYSKSLSEQYFFWASKPKCQDRPCPKQGSWVYKEYKKSKSRSTPDIPLEKDCPYNKSTKHSNVTQTPLHQNCNRGYAKIVNFEQINDNAQIISAIKNNTPVIGGFRLSKSFYHNNGHVFLHSPENKTSKLDSHAAGHALLLVGYMELPPTLHKTEGRFCLITANSWGIGWGKGGHACLSEKWINKYRYDMPFIALSKIKTI